LSKIDYALPIYGTCAKTNLKKIAPSYHTAVKRSLRAFTTSPTLAILAEAGLPTIEERVLELSLRLIPKLFLCNNKLLLGLAKNSLTYKKLFKRPSTIQRCVSYAKKIGVDCSPKQCSPIREPPWNLSDKCFQISLHKHPKNTTPPTTYQQLFNEGVHTYVEDEWELLYTDGSKTENYTSFAVVKSNGESIIAGHLYNFCSIFTAEATAILQAAEYAQKCDGKFLICTDSISTITAVRNRLNLLDITCKIRDILIRNDEKIKIMWVP